MLLNSGITLFNTPKANRLHISIFGKRNASKFSLINALTNQSIYVGSETPETTPDPVYLKQWDYYHLVQSL